MAGSLSCVRPPPREELPCADRVPSPCGCCPPAPWCGCRWAPRGRALWVRVDSLGGTVTASDVLHHEIRSFRDEKGVPVVAAVVEKALSGGYFVALAADERDRAGGAARRDRGGFVVPAARYAAITGWGKCAPPAVMTNDDLATFLDTSDEWIFSRSGIRRRHYSHVTTAAMARVAAEHALAAADLEPAALDLIVFGSTTPDDMIPNTGSKLKNALGATRAACFDLNAACSSFLYGLTVATDMIRAGSIQRALVVGAEKASWLLDWSRRESAVLFGDGAGAVVLEASAEEEGLVATRLGCVPDTREALWLPNWGHGFDRFADDRIRLSLTFDGKEIFRHAVRAMEEACVEVLAAAGWTPAEVGLFVPHQANARIIEALAKRLGMSMDRVMLCIDEYGNTSAASIPLALCDALETGRVAPGAGLLTAVFGAGLTWGSGLIRWGQRVTPLKRSDAALPPCPHTALELMAPSIAYTLGTRG